MKNKSIHLFLVLCIITSMLFIGCKKTEDKAQGDSSAGKSSETSSTISLSEDLMPIFTRSCGVCHKRQEGNKAAVTNGVYYETKDDVLAVKGKFIFAGEPEKSGLVKVLSKEYPVGKNKILMPPPKTEVPAWSKEEIEKFSQWISEGANDN